MICTFLFYNKARGKQAIFCLGSPFKHCNVLLDDGLMRVLVEMQPEGVGFNKLVIEDLVLWLQSIKRIESIQAIISIEIKERHQLTWWPFWIRSCSELSRYATGAHLGLTLTPGHLYKKLLKYDNKRNYQIIFQWGR